MSRNGRSDRDGLWHGDEQAGGEELTLERIEEVFVQGRSKTIDVKFVASDRGAYEMWQDGQQVSVLKFDKDKYDVNGQKMKKADHFVVEFSLVDRTTAKDLEVPPNPMNAIWICTPRQADPPTCPQTPTYDQQIYALGTDAKKGILYVRNEDMDREKFQFTLRFLHRGKDPSKESSYEIYDPPGENHNGGVAN